MMAKAHEASQAIDSAKEDIDLMLRASKDDEEAFCTLVRKHEQALMNFFASNNVYRDVEDLAQQTFLKLYRMRASYKPKAKFTTFLYLLAHQVLVDAVRHSQRLTNLHEKAGAESDTSIEPPKYRGEKEDAVAALAVLSSALRETVVLVIMHGFSYPEAATMLDVPVGTIKSRINAALAQMRDALANTNESAP